MSRWRTLHTNRLAAATFVLLTTTLLGSSGCELVSKVDRSDIPQGTGGAGGMGGNGGSGGMSECAQPSDCPGTDTVCQTRTCESGKCGVMFAEKGTQFDMQTPGDCQLAVCDGAGQVELQNDDTDVLDDMNDCTVDTCNAGTPQNAPADSGAACASNNGKVCDGAGTCVECVVGADCTEGVCTQNQCVPAACVDSVKNGTETDVDCGGADCAPCADGKMCGMDVDCQSKICTGGVCAMPTCSDGTQNGEETDKDCGGPTCNKCGPDQGCKVDGDCIGGSCSGSTCLPTCKDQTKNGNETDVDCGGPTCGGCADGQTCSVGSDCLSNVCSNGVCLMAACNDGVKNGTETDIDCGGSCGPCPTGGICNLPSECQSGVCTGNVCQMAACNDGVKNGNETDVDCGGATCSGCMIGKICTTGSDCASTVCNNGLCVAQICGDGKTTGTETCDDGNAGAGDGCDSACKIEMGYACMGAPSVCAPVCGDGFLRGAENCDDGGTAAGDGCDATCKTETGYLCIGEPSICVTECGDGIIAGMEACDDQNTANGDGCDSLCVVEPGYQCNGMPSSCGTVCGDGAKGGAEACDDGNTNSGDCCSSSCGLESGCETEANNTIATADDWTTHAIANKVKGFVDPTADLDLFKVTIPAGATGSIKAETLDGPLGSTCTSLKVDSFITIRTSAGVSLGTNDDVSTTNYCSLLTVGNLAAGDYYVEVKKSPLAGPNDTFDYTLQLTIVSQICGNGQVEGTEQCDGTPNCAADCTLLATCGDGVFSVGESCEDGNTTNGDGCSATCTWEGTVNEVEPNGTTAEADTNASANPQLQIDGNRKIAGAISPTADKDIYKIVVAAPSVVRFEQFYQKPNDCPGLATGTTMDVLTSIGTVLKTDTISGIGNCPAIVVPLDAGTYYLQLSRSSGTTQSYMIEARFQTDGGTETEPNETQAQASTFPGPEQYVFGDHQLDTDIDVYMLTVPTSGLSLRVETVEGDNSETCESLDLDTFITLYDSTFTSLLTDDDDGRGWCSKIDGTGTTPADSAAKNLAAGTYYIEVKKSSFASGTEGVFNYKLVASLRQP